MVKEYNFRFDELIINYTELISILGYENGSLPEPFDSYLQMAFDDASKFTDIKGAYLIIDEVSIVQNDFSLLAGGHKFDVGKAVCNELKGMEQLALYVCTAGRTISDKSINLLYGEDPVLGYIYDVLGSMITEAACDLMQSFLNLETKECGDKLTNRYSPGYCQWQVSDQYQLFSFFPENICGILLTESALMSPVKSVSGLIGIGKNVKYREYVCTLCSSKDGLYRKIKKGLQPEEK